MADYKPERPQLLRCEECKGEGVIVDYRSLPHRGQLHIHQECSICKGKGVVHNG